ncbi:hypothetical protein PKOR_04205 [Pontibacter korlensis]|uniref:Uncharacterized protein n=1 Tax=Pontibacter korlensis TaxID=400092 RepID=A0A0E3ZET7_9BACT|nr:hypothetical protein PKOR_04205 [Pontibacter korlensis]
MKVKDILAFVPDEDLALLAAQTRVDHQVKKLSGRASLRVMEDLSARCASAPWPSWSRGRPRATTPSGTGS